MFGNCYLVSLYNTMLSIKMQSKMQMDLIGECNEGVGTKGEGVGEGKHKKLIARDGFISNETT